MCNFVIHAVLMQNGKSMVFYYTPPRTPPTPLVTVMYGLFPRETFPPTFLLEIGPGIFQVYILGTPPLAPHPRNVTQQFTNILQINLIY